MLPSRFEIAADPDATNPFGTIKIILGQVLAELYYGMALPIVNESVMMLSVWMKATLSSNMPFVN